MPVGSDFTMVYFGEHLGDNQADLNVPWAIFSGNQTMQKTFNIDNRPAGEAYFLIQTFKVGNFKHKILVNGIKLDTYIPHHDGWQTSMIAIPQDILQYGSNTIQIVRDTQTSDNFVVGYVIIHWREILESLP